MTWNTWEKRFGSAGAYPDSAGETSTAPHDKSSLILQKQKQKLNKWCSLSLQTGWGGIAWPLAPAQAGLANPPALPQGLHEKKAIVATMSCASLYAGFPWQTLHRCCCPEAQHGDPTLALSLKMCLFRPCACSSDRFILVTLIETTFVPLQLKVPSFGCPTLNHVGVTGKPLWGWVMVTSPHHSCGGAAPHVHLQAMSCQSFSQHIVLQGKQQPHLC